MAPHRPITVERLRELDNASAGTYLHPSWTHLGGLAGPSTTTGNQPVTTPTVSSLTPELAASEPEEMNQPTIAQDTPCDDTPGQEPVCQDNAGQETQGPNNVAQDTEVHDDEETQGQETPFQDNVGRDSTGQDILGQDATGQDTADQDIPHQSTLDQHISDEDTPGRNSRRSRRQSSSSEDSIKNESPSKQNLRKYVYVPRRAAVKAADAIAVGSSRQHLGVRETAAVGSKKRKVSGATDATRKSSRRATRSPKVSNEVEEDPSVSLSDRPEVKKSRKASPKRSERIGKRALRKNVPKGTGGRVNTRAKRILPHPDTPESRRSFVTSDLDNDTIPDPEIEDSQDSDSIVIPPSNPVSGSRSAKLSSTTKNSAKEQGTATSGRATRPTTAVSRPTTKRQNPPQTSTNSTRTNLRATRRGTRANMAQQLPIRPWKIKDTTNYTAQDIDNILARDPPKDEIEYISHSSLAQEQEMRVKSGDPYFKIYNKPLIGGTTVDEQRLIDEEIALHGPGYVLQSVGGTRRIPQQYEMLPEDIELERNGRRILVAAAGAPLDAFEVDAPGSGTPYDALKFPNRLVERVNRDGKNFPDGWDEESISLIPNSCFEDIRRDLIATLPYRLLWNRPWEILKKLPDSAPFWDEWEKEDGEKIINAFIAKVKHEKAGGASHNFLADAYEPANVAVPQSTETRVFHPPTDFPYHGCKTCAKYGVECDGLKPTCKECIMRGHQCNYTEFFKTQDGLKHNLPESYMRTGSRYDLINGPGPYDSRATLRDTDVTKQYSREDQALLQDAAFAKAYEKAIVNASRFPPELQGLALLAEAAEMVGPLPEKTTEQTDLNWNRDLGSGSQVQTPSTLNLDKLPLPTQDFVPLDIKIESDGALTYVTMNSQEESFYARPSIRINVPDHLKNLLVDDWENVTKSLLLVPLPSQAPANYIIDDYFNEEKMNRRLGSPEADILEEFCAGLKMYFEKAVGKILLYRFERSQLAEVSLKSSQLSHIRAQILTSVPSLSRFASFGSLENTKIGMAKVLEIATVLNT